MTQAVSLNGINNFKKQNISFNGQLGLVVQKTLYRNSHNLPQITSENIGKQYPKVLSRESEFIKGVYEMSKQFIKLLPDDMKVFFSVSHSAGKSHLNNFSYKLSDEKQSKNFNNLYRYAEALNTEAKRRGLYKQNNDTLKIEKFTNALDRYADFFNIRARIDKTRIIDVDAQKAVDAYSKKSMKAKVNLENDLVSVLKGLGFSDEQIAFRLEQMKTMNV